MTSLHREPGLRAADADRDHVAGLLRDHYAVGRLRPEEFHGRLDDCYAAQTYGELQALVVDLPDPDPYADLPVPVHSGPGVTGWAPIASPVAPARSPWAAWLAVSALCWLVWLASVVATRGWVVLWPTWVMVWWGVAVAVRQIGRPRRH